MSADVYLIVLCDHPGCPAPEGHWPVRVEPHTHRALADALGEPHGHDWAHLIGVAQGVARVRAAVAAAVECRDGNPHACSVEHDLLGTHLDAIRAALDELAAAPADIPEPHVDWQDIAAQREHKLGRVRALLPARPGDDKWTDGVHAASVRAALDGDPRDDQPAEAQPDRCVHLRDGGCCSGPGYCAHACDTTTEAADDGELTAEEARDLADELGTELYRAQDALAFVAEMCDIADREGFTPTTARIRDWLKGAQCARRAGLVITDGPIADAVHAAAEAESECSACGGRDPIGCPFCKQRAVPQPERCGRYAGHGEYCDYPREPGGEQCAFHSAAQVREQPAETQPEPAEPWLCDDCGTTVPAGHGWCTAPGCPDPERTRAAAEAASERPAGPLLRGPDAALHLSEAVLTYLGALTPLATALRDALTDQR